MRHVDIVTVQNRLDLYAGKPPPPCLGQLQKLVSRAGHRLELHVNLAYQECLPSATIAAFREVAKAITVLLVGSSVLNALALDMVPLTRLTYLSFILPDSDAEGHQSVRAIQGLQHLRCIGVTFENANQLPALLNCLAGLSQLSELCFGRTFTGVCLNLSSLKCIMSLRMGDGIEFSHPPPNLTYYTIEGIPTRHMTSQLGELHNLTNVTLATQFGYEHLPTTLQKLTIHALSFREVCKHQLLAVGSLAQLRTLRISAFLKVELIHMLASEQFPHLQTFGFDLPNFTAANIEEFAFAGRGDTDPHCILVHVPFVVGMLSTAFPVLEVFEVGACNSGYQARKLMHLFDCSWMNQHTFPRLRGLTNRSSQLNVQFLNIPETCYLADIGFSEENMYIAVWNVANIVVASNAVGDELI